MIYSAMPIWCFVKIILFTGAGLFFGLAPFVQSVRYLSDEAMLAGRTPGFVTEWHRTISPGFESWAVERSKSTRAADLAIHDISGTEWPIFSAVYFLWATEALQAEWERSPSPRVPAPRGYASGAIEAAAALIRDPNQAAWVKAHWGEDYLSQKNIFYRMLLIAGLTSYQTVTGNRQHELLLIDQVNSLAAELDASPHGLLEDYPGQTYPIDILPAIAVIQRADRLLGLDHSGEIRRAERGFRGRRLDPHTGLPAYRAISSSGEGVGPSRGVGISYMLIWLPELWPETAERWFDSYEEHFWTENGLVSGVREFARDRSYPSFLFEVDAGPVLWGFGTAASAYGIGAMRANGRLERSIRLTKQAIVASWPLWNGRLLVPRALSNITDAPFLGETALLFVLSRVPVDADAVIPPTKHATPFVVWLWLGFYLSVGLLGPFAAFRLTRRFRRH